MKSSARLFAIGFAVSLAACVPQVQEAFHPPESSYTPMKATLVIEGASESAEIAEVTREFFMAGVVKAFLGRFFVDPEFVAVSTPVAVISHRYWTERFRAAPTVIGSQVQVNGTRMVIVGVAPPTFRPEKADTLWVPLKR